MGIEIKNLRIKVNVNAQKEEEVSLVEEKRSNWSSQEILTAVSNMMKNKKER
ncbi:hypothetical protein [Kordia zhangzhouensis]|uniref:hypothetical protein n=1 Tax=Kordia zhangzhouensis TaxID=1620405 RepID=UPI0012F84F95|nr:hypothetical protein [Kordia zhangzhouensis]